MKKLYRRNTEDFPELKEILLNSDFVEVDPNIVSIKDGKKTYDCHAVTIDNVPTFFTDKLYRFLVDNEILLQA